MRFSECSMSFCTIGALVISQSEQICKWGIKYAHLVTTDLVGNTCAPTTHIPSLTKIGPCVLIREWSFTFWCWRETYIHTSVHTYICTDSVTNKNLSGSSEGPLKFSSIAGGPQEQKRHVVKSNEGSSYISRVVRETYVSGRFLDILASTVVPNPFGPYGPGPFIIWKNFLRSYLVFEMEAASCLWSWTISRGQNLRKGLHIFILWMSW